MIQLISKTAKIRAKLRAEGKVTTLDSPEHLEAIVRMNESLLKIRREYRIKAAKSEIGASKIILMQIYV